MTNADKFLGYATEGAQRHAGAHSDLLAFSRLGRNGFTRSNVDGNAVMKEVLQALAPAIRRTA